MVIAAYVLVSAGVISVGKTSEKETAVSVEKENNKKEVPEEIKAEPEAETVPEAAPQPVIMYVANVENSIYLRSTPSEASGNIILTIPVGTEIGYIEQTNSVFSKIKYNGRVGYAKTKFLEDNPPGSDGTYLTVCNVPNSIYLRSAAVEDPDNIICTIPVGSTVKLVTYGNGTFYRISWGGYTGFAKAKYLK